VEGRALLAITVDARGALRSLSLDPARSSFGDIAVATCVKAALEQVGFPTSPDGREATVEYPLRLRLIR